MLTDDQNGLVALARIDGGAVARRARADDGDIVEHVVVPFCYAKKPAAYSIDIDDEGNITGLF